MVVHWDHFTLYKVVALTDVDLDVCTSIYMHPAYCITFYNTSYVSQKVLMEINNIAIFTSPSWYCTAELLLWRHWRGCLSIKPIFSETVKRIYGKFCPKEPTYPSYLQTFFKKFICFFYFVSWTWDYMRGVFSNNISSESTHQIHSFPIGHNVKFQSSVFF